MTEFERKLMQLTPEQSRELSAAMNAGYNKRLADKKPETELERADEDQQDSTEIK